MRFTGHFVKRIIDLIGSQKEIERKPVAKIDSSGEIVAFYSSAREAGRENYMSYQTIIDRCNGKVQGAFAPDGYAYSWDEDRKTEAVIRKIKALRKVKEE